ncbi:MAG: peptidyl-tRNA hydrolase [Spirochaetes bacterium]|jgi:PTH2 family peptidyl-tRNA hydrolase|nr:MAG: peptidyl-tRNA hydrolase [Spirochaetota bacterium]
MIYPQQVIVVRKDLKMRRGKEIAQSCHASTGILLHNLPKVIWYKLLYKMNIKLNNAWYQWLNGSFTKITVYVNSEQELLDTYEKAKTANLPTVLITDKGLTEFNGVPTNTCIAIGPVYKPELIGITNHLPLL